MQVMNDINLQACLSIYHNRDDDETITLLLAKDHRELLEFKKGVNDYQEFYQPIYQTGLELYECNNLSLMNYQCIQMITALMNPSFKSAQQIFQQDERILFVNKLFAKVALPNERYEFQDSINTVSCIRNLLSKIELRKLSGIISSDKLLKEQLMEEDKYFNQFMENLFNLYNEAQQQQKIKYLEKF